MLSHNERSEAPFWIFDAPRWSRDMEGESCTDYENAPIRVFAVLKHHSLKAMTQNPIIVKRALDSK